MSGPGRGLAVSVMPLENRRETLLAVATAADQLGDDAFFLPETWAFDVTVLLAEVAVRTSGVGLGSGILSVWGRSRAHWPHLTPAAIDFTLNAFHPLAPPEGERA